MNDTVILTIPPLEHPLAGQTMTGAQHGGTGHCGRGRQRPSSATAAARCCPVYDAVFLYNEQQATRGRRQLPLIVPANEQGAGFMAAGYSRSTGQVGVALVTSGPGATNMVTPVRDCIADSIPMVVICGQVPRAAIGSDAFQEAPIASVMGAVAKHVFLVTDPEKLEGTIRAAFELARTGRPGPGGGRHPEGCAELAGRLPGTRHGRLHRRLPEAHARAGCAPPFRGAAGVLLLAAGQARSGR